MASLLPLTLGSRRLATTLAEEHRQVMAGPLRAEVIRADGNRCRFCGLASAKWMEIFHLDGDHANTTRANLATACPLCHQCDHLHLAGLENGGMIIWLPEIEQGVLNALAVAIFVAIVRKAPYADAAREMYAQLQSRAALIEERTGQGASHPSLWARELAALDPKDYERRHAALAGIRLLPVAARFLSPIRYWAASEFRAAPVDDWSDLHRAASSVLEAALAHEEPEPSAHGAPLEEEFPDDVPA